MTFSLSPLVKKLGGLKSFVMKHVRLAIIGALIVVGLVILQHAVHQYGEAQFKRGVDATIAQMKTEVAKRNVVNRAVEERADTGLREFANQKEHDDAIRHTAEQKSQTKITTSVDSVPMWNSKECAITPQVMTERNAIRALGPQEEGDTK